MATKSKKRPELTGNALPEKALDQVAGGFNPQPDPPGDLVAQTRVQPIVFAIRVRPIGG
jgi:hypothetical protein